MRIPFYYDYACPWAWLGSCRVEAYFADLGVDIDFVPVQLRDLVEPSPDGGPSPKMGPRKQKNYIADLLHWASLSEVEISPRARDLIKSDTRPALRVALVAKETDRFGAYHHAAYRARWTDARDVSDPAVLAPLIAEAGLDPDDVLERAASDDVDQQLTKLTKEAIDRGVFGVPTLFVGEEMFWGNDRFEVARHFIQKTA